MNTRIISQSYISQLSDWEIISAFIFCNDILQQKDPDSIEEFKSMCLFFFDNKKESAIESIKDVQRLYQKEYQKRHIN